MLLTFNNYYINYKNIDFACQYTTIGGSDSKGCGLSRKKVLFCTGKAKKILLRKVGSEIDVARGEGV